MVNGLLGSQVDPDVFFQLGRGHHTLGEDPFLNDVTSAGQIYGIQGQAQLRGFSNPMIIRSRPTKNRG
jgi:hypothetical protein